MDITGNEHTYEDYVAKYKVTMPVCFMKEQNTNTQKHSLSLTYMHTQKYQNQTKILQEKKITDQYH